MQVDQRFFGFIARGTHASGARCEQALPDEWVSAGGLEGKSNQAAIGNAFKAWRFVGEMVEISNTMQAGGLPAGFHQGAAELYEALAEFKDQMDTPPETVYQKLSGN